MGRLRALLVWLLRAWPLIVICGVFGVHLLLLQMLPESSQRINSAASLLSQILGGLLVLHSINSAIGLVKKGSLLSTFFKYLGEFPLFKRSATIFASASGSIGVHGVAKLRVTRKPQTIEERIDYLQEQITEVRWEMSAEFKKVWVRIENVAKDSATGIDNNARDIRSLRETFEKSIAGSLQEQVFGVLLVLYGGISAYVT